MSGQIFSLGTNFPSLNKPIEMSVIDSPFHYYYATARWIIQYKLLSLEDFTENLHGAGQYFEQCLNNFRISRRNKVKLLEFQKSNLQTFL